MIATALVIVTDNAEKSVATANEHEAFNGVIVIEDGSMWGDPSTPDPKTTGISYDKNSRVLTLDNATINAGSRTISGDNCNVGIVVVKEDNKFSATISLKGSNKIVMPSDSSNAKYDYGIYLSNYRSLKIVGDDPKNDSLSIDFSITKMNGDNPAILYGINNCETSALNIVNCTIDVGFNIDDSTFGNRCDFIGIRSDRTPLSVYGSIINVHLDKIVISGTNMIEFYGIGSDEYIVLCSKSDITVTSVDIGNVGSSKDNALCGIKVGENSVTITECKLSFNFGKAKADDKGKIYGIYAVSSLIVNSDIDIKMPKASYNSAIDVLGDVVYKSDFKDVKSIKYASEIGGELKELTDHEDSSKIVELHVVANGVSPTPVDNNSSAIDPIVIVIAIIVILPIIAVASLLFSHKP